MTGTAKLAAVCILTGFMLFFIALAYGLNNHSIQQTRRLEEQRQVEARLAEAKKNAAPSPKELNFCPKCGHKLK